MESILLKYKIVLLSVFIGVIAFLAISPASNISQVSADAVCGDGWFCGIDQGYGIVVDRQGWKCSYDAFGQSYCDTDGFWNCNRTYDCKSVQYTVSIGSGWLCKGTGFQASCQESVEIISAAGNRPSCSKSGPSSCSFGATVYTGCCVKEPAPTPTPTSIPTPPPAGTCSVIQGFKVMMPGNVNTEPARSQTVSVSGSGSSESSTANPYFLASGDSEGSKTVSVSVPSGYTAGYTLCMDSVGCHGNPPTPGSSVTFDCSDDSFADLWWHFTPPACSVPAAPTGLSPSSVLSCRSNETLTWNAVAGADSYAIRVDDQSNGWNGDCASPNPGDFCADVVGTSYTFNVECGKSYNWWVHAINSCGWSPSAAASFSLDDAGRIQGRRVSSLGCPADGTSVTINVNCPSFSQSYNLFNDGSAYGTPDVIPFGETCTVSTTEPAGSEASYSVNYNNIAHDPPPYVTGNSVDVIMPNTPASGYYTAYTDLYWRYSCVPVACSIPTLNSPTTFCTDPSFSTIWTWPAVPGATLYWFQASIPIAVPYSTGWLPASDFGCEGGGVCTYQTNNHTSGVTYNGRVSAWGGAGGCEISEWSSVEPATTTCNPLAWWQAHEGDLMCSQGGCDIVSQVPILQSLITNDSGADPGIPIAVGLVDAFPGSISSSGWNVENANPISVIYDYNYFYQRIPDEITPTDPGASITVNSLATLAPEDDRGYRWYYRDGDLTITNPGASSIGGNKVIVIVRHDLFINGKILLNDGLGFFMIITGSETTINDSVGDPAVANSTPDLEGLYFTGGEFITTDSIGSDLQLHVRGSVAIEGDMVLARSLDDNTTYAAELFEYAPDQILAFPIEFGAQRILWREVAP